MEKIKIAKIVNVVGLKGELKVYHYCDYKQRFEELDRIILSGRKDEKTFEIEKVRYQGDIVILKLKGIDDRNQAETLKEYDICITENDLRELPEDTFYLRDLIGCEIEDQKYGAVGTISDVLQNSAQDIYVVKSKNGKEYLIPAVKEFIKEIDIPGRKVRTSLIEGFVDECIEA